MEREDADEEASLSSIEKKRKRVYHEFLNTPTTNVGGDSVGGDYRSAASQCTDGPRSALHAREIYEPVKSPQKRTILPDTSLSSSPRPSSAAKMAVQRQELSSFSSSLKAGSKKNAKMDVRSSDETLIPQHRDGFEDTLIHKPKRPRTAYNFFVQSERSKIVENMKQQKSATSPISPGEDVNFQSIGKTLGKTWNNMSPASKLKYDDLAKQDTERYASQMKEYYTKSYLHPMYEEKISATTEESARKEVPTGCSSASSARASVGMAAATTQEGLDHASIGKSHGSGTPNVGQGILDTGDPRHVVPSQLASYYDAFRPPSFPLLNIDGNAIPPFLEQALTNPALYMPTTDYTSQLSLPGIVNNPTIPIGPPMVPLPEHIQFMLAQQLFASHQSSPMTADLVALANNRYIGHSLLNASMMHQQLRRNAAADPIESNALMIQALPPDVLEELIKHLMEGTNPGNRGP